MLATFCLNHLPSLSPKNHSFLDFMSLMAYQGSPCPFVTSSYELGWHLSRFGELVTSKPALLWAIWIASKPLNFLSWDVLYIVFILMNNIYIRFTSIEFYLLCFYFNIYSLFLDHLCCKFLVRITLILYPLWKF